MSNDKFGILSNSSAQKRFKFIPPSLLSSVIPDDQMHKLNAEERRIYGIQKAKYDASVKIIAKKEVDPKDTIFDLEKAKLLIDGKYHEEFEDEE